MNDASLRQDHHDHESGGQVGGSGVAGKRTRTEALQRKAEGTAPPPAHADAPAPVSHDDMPKPTSGQSYVDSIVHGAVDPAKVAAEQIASGLRDENKLTNEVFWQLQPEQRDKKLTAGSADAVEWLRLRDEIVRPALAKHHAAPEGADKAREVDGAELAKHTHAVTPRTDAVQPSGNPAIDALLASVPANGAPNQIEAAWLLKALKTGLFGAYPATLGQLTQIANGEKALRTSDGVSGEDAIQRGIANLEKQKIQARHVGTKDRRMQYEVEAGNLPVLGAMVDLAAGRLRAYVRGGMKDKGSAFVFGDMVRADVDYAEANKHSAHTGGNAIDLGGMNYNSEEDVVGVLSGLEPKKINMVFPDGGVGSVKAHVHLAVTDGGKYELGIPFSPAFFQVSDSVFTRQKQAQEAAGGDKAEEGKVAHAEGLIQWHTVWYQASGVFKGGKWHWTRTATKGDSARNHIKSGALKALLDRLHSGSSAKVSVQAAKEDGVDPKTEGHHD